MDDTDDTSNEEQEVDETTDESSNGDYNYDQECLDNGNCHRPCHKKFLAVEGECNREFKMKYNPSDYEIYNNNYY